MQQRKRIFALIAILTVISATVAGIGMTMLYNAAFEEQRARLVDTARSEARTMEAMAHHAEEMFPDKPDAQLRLVIQQITDAHTRYQGLGETGEFTLARREGGNIVFLLRRRHADLDNPRPVPFDSDLAEPTRHALSGQSGSVVALDYRGEMVLAAHEPVAVQGFALVVKIDLAEIRAPFITAALAAVAIGLLLIAAGALLFYRISDPLIGELQSTSAYLRAILGNIIDGVIVINENGIIESFSAAAERLFGYKADEVVGRNVSLLMTDSDRDQHDNYMERYLRTGEARVIGVGRQVTGRRKDGTTLPMEIGIGEMHIGGRRMFTGLVRDVSERIAAEELAKSVRERLVAAIEGYNSAIALFDADDKLASYNDAYAKEVEDTFDLEAGLSFEDIAWVVAKKVFLPERTADEEEAWVRKRIERHIDPAGPFEQTFNDGRHVLVNEQRLPDGSTLLVRVDITDRVAAEKRAKSAQESLAAAIDLHDSLVAIFDADDRLILCNQAYTRECEGVIELKPGTSFEEITRAFVERSYHPTAVAREDHWIYDRLHRHRNPSHPFEQTLSDGRHFVINEQHLPDGGTLAVWFDITNRKRAEQALLESEARFRDFAEATAD